MYHTTNLRLYQAAKDLSRNLRKTQTYAEKVFWENVRNRRFRGLKFYRQYPIFYKFDNKESFIIADFFCFEKRTIIEIDGKIHLYRAKKDAKRTEILNILGIKVLRFTNEEVENETDKVIAEILDVFESEKSLVTNSHLNSFDYAVECANDVHDHE